MAPRVLLLGSKFGRTGNRAALMQGWQGYLAANRTAPDDVNALVALVLRESYLQAPADLKQHAEKVSICFWRSTLRIRSRS